MSVEDLSETLFQIKVCILIDLFRTTRIQGGVALEPYCMLLLLLQVFRMQQESREGLSSLWADGKREDSPRELANLQASHAETVLELRKTRQLLLLEHRITTDLQVHSNGTHKHIDYSHFS